MPLTTATALGLLAAATAVGGVGSGIAAAEEAAAQQEAAKEAARGPVRGGTERAGNKDELALTLNPSIAEKIGQTAVPMRPPVYGSTPAGAPNLPVDLDKLFQPKAFGTGFSRKPAFTNIPRRFS